MIASVTRVTLHRRKGLIRLVKAEDTLLHFQWWDRTTCTLEDDQIVFPEEATVEKVRQSSGRVYLLKFKHDDRKSFFWIQNQMAKMNWRIHRSLNQRTQLRWLATCLRRRQLQAGDSSPLASVIPGATSSGVVQLADLQRILTGLEANLAMARETGPGFSELLRPDIVRPLLDNLQLEERLAPYLPEGVRTKQAIAALVQSPQFHQQLDAFTQVIRSTWSDRSISAWH